MSPCPVVEENTPHSFSRHPGATPAKQGSPTLHGSMRKSQWQSLSHTHWHLFLEKARKTRASQCPPSDETAPLSLLRHPRATPARQGSHTLHLSRNEAGKVSGSLSRTPRPTPVLQPLSALSLSALLTLSHIPSESLKRTPFFLTQPLSHTISHTHPLSPTQSLSLTHTASASRTTCLSHTPSL